MKNLIALKNRSTKGKWTMRSQWSGAICDDDGHAVGTTYTHSDAEYITAAINAMPELLNCAKHVQQLLQLITEMGTTIRSLDDDNAHYEQWTMDGEYVPDERFKQALATLERLK